MISSMFPGGFSNTLELHVAMVGCNLNMKDHPMQCLTCFYLHPKVLNTIIWSTGTVRVEGQDVNLEWGEKKAQCQNNRESCKF